MQEKDFPRTVAVPGEGRVTMELQILFFRVSGHSCSATYIVNRFFTIHSIQDRAPDIYVRYLRPKLFGCENS
jgi:hypothetical protein